MEDKGIMYKFVSSTLTHTLSEVQQSRVRAYNRRLAAKIVLNEAEQAQIDKGVVVLEELDTDRYLYVAVAGVHGDENDDRGRPKGNDNGDYFPWEELIKVKPSGVRAYETWIGKPVLLDHNPEKQIGVIIDAYPIEGEKSIDFLLAIDKKKAPNVVKGIIEGVIKDVSIGVEVDYGICSVCGNIATKTEELCEHMINYKGKFNLDTSEWIYEINRGLTGFEISIITQGVGADPQAKIKQVVAKNKGVEKMANEFNYQTVSSGDNLIKQLYESMERVEQEMKAHREKVKASEEAAKRILAKISALSDEDLKKIKSMASSGMLPKVESKVRRLIEAGRADEIDDLEELKDLSPAARQLIKEFNSTPTKDIDIANEEEKKEEEEEKKEIELTDEGLAEELEGKEEQQENIELEESGVESELEEINEVEGEEEKEEEKEIISPEEGEEEIELEEEKPVKIEEEEVIFKEGEEEGEEIAEEVGEAIDEIKETMMELTKNMTMLLDKLSDIVEGGTMKHARKKVAQDEETIKTDMNIPEQENVEDIDAMKMEGAESADIIDEEDIVEIENVLRERLKDALVECAKILGITPNDFIALVSSFVRDALQGETEWKDKLKNKVNDLLNERRITIAKKRQKKAEFIYDNDEIVDEESINRVLNDIKNAIRRIEQRTGDEIWEDIRIVLERAKNEPITRDTFNLLVGIKSALRIMLQHQGITEEISEALGREAVAKRKVKSAEVGINEVKDKLVQIYGEVITDMLNEIVRELYEILEDILAGATEELIDTNELVRALGLIAPSASENETTTTEETGGGEVEEGMIENEETSEGTLTQASKKVDAAGNVAIDEDAERQIAEIAEQIRKYLKPISPDEAKELLKKRKDVTASKEEEDDTDTENEMGVKELGDEKGVKGMPKQAERKIICEFVEQIPRSDSYWTVKDEDGTTFTYTMKDVYGEDYDPITAYTEFSNRRFASKIIDLHKEASMKRTAQDEQQQQPQMQGEDENTAPASDNPEVNQALLEPEAIEQIEEPQTKEGEEKTNIIPLLVRMFATLSVSTGIAPDNILDQIFNLLADSETRGQLRGQIEKEVEDITGEEEAEGQTEEQAQASTNEETTPEQTGGNTGEQTGQSANEAQPTEQQQQQTSPAPVQAIKRLASALGIEVDEIPKYKEEIAQLQKQIELRDKVIRVSNLIRELQGKGIVTDETSAVELATDIVQKGDEAIEAVERLAMQIKKVETMQENVQKTAALDNHLLLYKDEKQPTMKMESADELKEKFQSFLTKPPMEEIKKVI